MKDYALTKLILHANLIKGRTLKYCPNCGWNTSHCSPVENEYTEHAITSLIIIAQAHELYVTDLIVMTTTQHIVDTIPFDDVLLSLKEECTYNLARHKYNYN